MVRIGTPFCWLHLQTLRHVRIRDSTIQGAGKGLFAWNPKLPPTATVFSKGVYIIEYDGEVVTGADISARYQDFTAPYAIRTLAVSASDPEIYVDAALRRGAGALVNEAPAPETVNAGLRYVMVREGGAVIVIQATADIANGSEIFVTYGSDYVMESNEPRVRYVTTRANAKK